MRRLFEFLSSVLFPASCLGCSRRGSALCGKCTSRIPLAAPTSETRLFALYDYGNRLVEKAVRNLKYYRKGEAALALMHRGAPLAAEWIGSILQANASETILVVPIPQHRLKSSARGYNQSELLARAVADTVVGARFASLLRKPRFTLPQAHIKQKSERLTNLKESMEAINTLDPALLYLLVDDVTTTGATFTEASRALRKAGARRILSLALAHGYARKK